jgi:hypothetical protein
MVLVLTKKRDKTLKQQLDELLSKPRVSKPRQWNDFFGKVKVDEDPVAYQRSLRDE